MSLPSTEHLKAKVSRENPDHHRRLENLKASLKSAYKMVNRANRKSHFNNKRSRDGKAKLRKFEVGDMVRVYLYCPAMKPGLSRKFRIPWSGPFKINNKISDLNYDIVDQNGKKQTVHVNRLKPAHNSEIWKPKTERKFAKNRPKKPVTRPVEESEEEGIRVRPLPLTKANRPEDNTDHEISPNPKLSTPEPLPQITDTPAS